MKDKILYDKEKPEIYRHFKGNEYLLIAIATNESDGEQVVVYQSLHDGKVWVRPLKSFCEEVPDGKENPTKQKFRFEKLYF